MVVMLFKLNFIRVVSSLSLSLSSSHFSLPLSSLLHSYLSPHLSVLAILSLNSNPTSIYKLCLPEPLELPPSAFFFLFIYTTLKIISLL